VKVCHFAVSGISGMSHMVQWHDTGDLLLFLVAPFIVPISPVIASHETNIHTLFVVPVI